MADASRFPRLAPPFAVVGAAAGWLSAALLGNPILGFSVNRPLTALVAAALAALTGVIVKRLCVGRRYWYEIGDPDPDVRPRTDVWPLHAVVMIAAGAGTGALVGTLDKAVGHPGECAASGAVCALAFVPVGLAVIAAARRAQRARLGSIVADSDRRAVWGILAATLAVTTLEALPDWAAALEGDGRAPWAAPGMLLAAGAATLWILRADRRAQGEAREATREGLTAREPEEIGPVDPGVGRVDLGLGDEVQARLARGAAAYRHRERTVALVQGSPEHAFAALARAARRGAASLAVIGAVGALHLTATTMPARATYEELRCRTWSSGEACSRAAAILIDRDPARAHRLLRRGGIVTR
jgi:hypothetical protein